MDDRKLIKEARALGPTVGRAAAVIASSPLAPCSELSRQTFGNWYSRGRIALAWRAAVLERLGYVRLVKGKWRL